MEYVRERDCPTGEGGARTAPTPAATLIDLSRDDLERLRHGSVDALEVVYRAFGDRVYRICRGMLGQRTDAEDAVQDVFLRVFDKVGTFSGRSRFSTWIHRLTVNHCLNRLTARSRTPRPLPDLGDDLEPQSAAPSPLEVSCEDEAREHLDQSLQRLDPAARAIIVLREIDQLGYQEIADTLDIPIGTVMSRLSRARQKLYGLMEPGVSMPARRAE